MKTNNRILLAITVIIVVGLIFWWMMKQQEAFAETSNVPEKPDITITLYSESNYTGQKKVLKLKNDEHKIFSADEQFSTRSFELPVDIGLLFGTTSDKLKSNVDDLPIWISSKDNTTPITLLSRIYPESTNDIGADIVITELQVVPFNILSKDELIALMGTEPNVASEFLNTKESDA